MSGSCGIGTKKLNISLNQGADFNLVIQVSGDAGPINLTGYAFRGEMRQSTATDGSAVAEFDFAILDQGASPGQVAWSLPADTISDIATSVANPLEKCRLATPFLYDVKMKDAGGAITRILQGTAYVSPQATLEDFS